MAEEETSELKLDFEEDPIIRLQKEIEFYKDDFTKATIGNFILERLQKDNILKNNYKEKRFTIDDCIEFINSTAQESLKNKDGCVEDKVVFGWVLHYLQDEPASTKSEVILTKETKETLKAQAEKEYKEECIAKMKEEQEKEIQKAIDKANKEKKKLEEEKEKSGQLSLFDI